MAEFTSKHLLKEVMALQEMFPDNINQAFIAAFENIDREADRILKSASVGTTVCLVHVTPSEIRTFNIGDSRAILISFKNGVVDLSRDHKPSEKSEEDRILRSGGFITLPEQGDGVHRVMGRLSLSRALGDWELRPWVSPTPDVTVRSRLPDDDYVFIASDGVWDVMSSVEVGKMLYERVFKGAASLQRRDKNATSTEQSRRHHIDSTMTQVVEEALKSILVECRARGSGDNITMILLNLQDVNPTGISGTGDATRLVFRH